ncbi:MAG: heavy-metal-associated domain-containing protein [Eubacterium sp.]|nr:heavy-metal-associated domain-containing protein [Eubacterium sp.]
MTALIVLILAAVIILALAQVVKRARRGSSCCGEHEETIRKKPVKERNKSHYPYTLMLSVGGMTCDNCARRVENALNALEGVWADVQIGTRQAVVRCKEKPDERLIRDVVRQAGYVVLDIE